MIAGSDVDDADVVTDACNVIPVSPSTTSHSSVTGKAFVLEIKGIVLEINYISQFWLKLF